MGSPEDLASAGSEHSSEHNSPAVSPQPKIEAEELPADENALPQEGTSNEEVNNELITGDSGNDDPEKQEHNIKMDENDEIDLDALFAGDLAVDLDDAMEAPESVKEGDTGNNKDSETPNEPQTDSKTNSSPGTKPQSGSGDAPQNSTESSRAGLENDPLFGMDLPEEDNMPPLGQDQPFQSKEEAERERMKLLVSHFDEQQMSRYAAYRRANIRRASIKKFASQLLNQPITNSVALVLGGMSKVLIGDIIELARDLQDKEEALERKRRNLPDPAPGSEPEPLLPSYIREAWNIYNRDTRTIPGTKTSLGSMNRMF